MKKIEGLDLGKLVDVAYTEVLAEQTVEVQRKIRGIVNDLASRTVDREKAEKALIKAKEAEQKLIEKISKIKAGDWTVLGEEKPE